jgi:MGT family glycosyltransferase
VSRHVVITLHDAGGTVPPTIALAQALLVRGDEVTILSQPSVRARAQAIGCQFVTFASLPDYDPRRAFEDQLEVTVPALVGAEIGGELLELATRTGADVVVVDPNLAGSLAAAATLDRPSVVLLHSMYATYVDTWFADIWPLLADLINETRSTFGLAAAASWADLLDEHDLLVSGVPEAFDAPATRKVPTSLRHVGFLNPTAPNAATDVSFPPGDGPTVLVGLSTTYQHQEHLLDAIVEALATLPVRGLVTAGGPVPADSVGTVPNVAVVGFAPHAALLPHTDLMITHAGLGTIAAAVDHGVPLVCTPMERDQPLNAARVADLGAGVVASDHTPGAIAEAVEAVLADLDGYRRAAADLGERSREDGGAARAAEEIASLGADIASS